jgi:two-component system chemotaxis response regulator CheY
MRNEGADLAALPGATRVKPDGIRFLVVDDFAAMRHIVRDLLEELGFTDVDEAEDGAAALRKLRHGGFDFVITDAAMPNMDGLTLVRRLRGDAATRALPVLLMLAEAKPDGVVAAALAGASGYIVRPFSAATLHAKLARVLGRAGD